MRGTRIALFAAGAAVALPVSAPAATGDAVVATARVHSLPVYRYEHSAHAFAHLRHPTPIGAPLVFLVRREGGERVRVYLPLRPNGSSGWVRRRDVSLAVNLFRVRVNRRLHRITVWRGTRTLLHERVGVGRTVTPTPSGTYFITELLKQPDPSGPYGPYAFGLSAHSNALHTFAGGDGAIGIHGTNEPNRLGTDVSHGCIRVRNATIVRLARILPLGTPVLIVS
jgi:hypothetical protein